MSYVKTPDGLTWVGPAGAEVQFWRSQYEMADQLLQPLRRSKLEFDKLQAELKQAYENLTAVQARCTELLEETRRLKNERAKGREWRKA